MHKISDSTGINVRRAMLFQVLLAVYLQVVEWIPLGSWNNVANGNGQAQQQRLSPQDETTARADLGRLQTELAKLQGENPLIMPVVDRQAVAEVVSGWTGIPVDRMLEGERERLLGMEKQLETRVVGQDAAVRAVSKAVRRARAGLKDPARPAGSTSCGRLGHPGSTRTWTGAPTCSRSNAYSFTVSSDEYSSPRT